jgi:hypothetical protein
MVVFFFVFFFFFKNFCSWLRSKLVYYVTAFAPLWTDQRLLALRMGGHVLSRNFRYYVPDVSGQSTVQTPVVVR